MSPGDILPYLLGSSGCLVLALVVAYLFQAGRWHGDKEFRKVEAERDEYRMALETERKAVDEYARTGSTTNRLIEALTQVATGRPPAVKP